MHVTIGVIALNEEEFIERNLRQHYALADKIVVVEGADRLYPRERVTESGLSTDATATIVRDFPDPDKKLTFIQHGWTQRSGDQAKCELRNRYMEHVRDGLLVVIDADEFYRHKDLAEFIADIRKDNRHAWRLPTLHFWKSTDQFITGGYYNVEHIRFWRVQASDRYVRNHNYVERSGKFVQDLGLCRMPRNIVEIGDGFTIAGPTCMHFGFCKRAENMADKNQYYCNRGERKTRANTIRSREAWFAEQLPADLQLHKFGGELPEVFRG